MYRENPEGKSGDNLDLEELIRLARTHQDIAQVLLAQLEKRFHVLCPEGSPKGDGPSRWNFTERERHVAQLLAEGLSNRRIARTLGISERTVKNHLHSIFYKLGVGDRTQAVIKLMRRP